MIKFYQVGGSVRDEFLGIKSKDLDYAVEAPSFEAMREAILNMNGTIFVEKPEFFTIRANIPMLGACDYVLCRKDGKYEDGRRPSFVEPGTIFDDLSRRDFTMNAIAKCVNTGEIIDPFDGRKDIKNGVLRTVGSPWDRFEEDGLRILRAIRFMVTKAVVPSEELKDFLLYENIDSYLEGVSKERIREEFFKMFKYSTAGTLRVLYLFPSFINQFSTQTGLWLKPTLEEK